VANRGLLRGLGIEGWKFYDPAWYSTVQPGSPAPTQPAIGNGTIRGRYTRTPAGVCIAQVQLIAGSTTSFGTGDAYILGLPKPGNRWTAALGLSTADIPIGTGLAWQGTAANPSLTMPLIPTLADPLTPLNLQTNEDYFAHLFIQQSIAYGTGSILSGTTSVTVTAPLGQSASAYDIRVVPTATTSNNPGILYVDSISYSNPNLSFNVNVRTNPGASNLPFAYKVRAEPESTVNFAQLLNYQRPWTMASGHGLFAQFVYESRY